MGVNTTILLEPRADDIQKVFASIVRTTRPYQWIKNIFVLAPLLFSGHFRYHDAVASAVLATIAFTLSAAATYFFNDLADRARDREHPVKSLRPIAAGQISIYLAVPIALLFAVLGLSLGAYLNLATVGGIVAYLLLQLIYTLWLKHKAIADVMCIALSFVLRVIIGAAAISVQPSPWLLVCTLFLATFFAFAKRRGETVRLSKHPAPSAGSRPVLIVYHDQLLLSLLSITCALTLLSYALYTVTIQPSSVLLLTTIPVVAYGLFRYLLLVLLLEGNPECESPETLVLKDRGLIMAASVWVTICFVAELLSPLSLPH